MRKRLRKVDDDEKRVGFDENVEIHSIEEELKDLIIDDDENSNLNY